MELFFDATHEVNISINTVINGAKESLKIGITLFIVYSACKFTCWQKWHVSNVRALEQSHEVLEKLF